MPVIHNQFRLKEYMQQLLQSWGKDWEGIFKSDGGLWPPKWSSTFQTKTYQNNHKKEIAQALVIQWYLEQIKHYYTKVENPPYYEFDPKKLPEGLTSPFVRDFLYNEALKAIHNSHGALPYNYLFQRYPSYDNVQASIQVDKKEICRWPDKGIVVYELLTPKALDEETEKMGHCIGNGGYDKGLLDGTLRFFSLRTIKGDTGIATLEVGVQDKHVYQCKGKDDGIPNNNKIVFIQKFIEEQHFIPFNDLRNMGYCEARPTKGRQELYKLQNIKAIPQGTVFDYLDLSELPINEFPSNICVEKDLSLRNCVHIEYLPDNLAPTGEVDLSGTFIKTLPASMKKVERLILNDCTKLTKLNDKMQINDLDMQGCRGCMSLPKELKIKHDLFLTDSGITKLPDDLQVGGHIYATKEQLKYVPKHLKDKIKIDDTASKRHTFPNAWMSSVFNSNLGR